MRGRGRVESERDCHLLSTTAVSRTPRTSHTGFKDGHSSCSGPRRAPSDRHGRQIPRPSAAAILDTVLCGHLPLSRSAHHDTYGRTYLSCMSFSAAFRLQIIDLVPIAPRSGYRLLRRRAHSRNTPRPSSIFQTLFNISTPSLLAPFPNGFAFHIPYARQSYDPAGAPFAPIRVLHNARRRGWI